MHQPREAAQLVQMWVFECCARLAIEDYALNVHAPCAFNFFRMRWFVLHLQIQDDLQKWPFTVVADSDGLPKYRGAPFDDVALLASRQPL
jgi:hypothetical protein